MEIKFALIFLVFFFLITLECKTYKTIIKYTKEEGGIEYKKRDCRSFDEKTKKMRRCKREEIKNYEMSTM